MTEYKSFQTPLKEQQENMNIPMTADLTPDHNLTTADYKIDYKLKTFKLMKQLAESEMQNKKNQTQIRHFQKEIQAYRKEMQKILKMLGVGNFQQANKKIDFILQTDKKMGNSDKLNEWTSIIEEYKKIINAQQYKYIKLQQQFKISEVKLKRYEQEKFQTIREKAEQASKPPTQNVTQNSQQLKSLKDENGALQKNVESLEEQVAVLKKQYKQAIIQRDHIKQLFQQLQNKYNIQIQHFEQMEKHVEERLIQVEKEMNYYRQERQEHLQKIELMKKEIDYRQSESYYSFGGMKNIQIQTEEVEQMPQFDNQCLEISIKTLLEENQRLKNTLITLYTNRMNEELPKEIELQLKILVNMKESLIKSEKRQRSNSIQQNQQKKNHQVKQNQIILQQEQQHNVLPQVIPQQEYQEENIEKANQS